MHNNMNGNNGRNFEEYDDNFRTQYDEVGADDQLMPVRKKKKEKFGFYLAFAICLVAVGMAVFSTYTGLTGYITNDNGDSMEVTKSVEDELSVPVNNVVTGVIENDETDTRETEAPKLIISETRPTVVSTDPQATETTEDALQTMLSVSDTLSPPLTNFIILKPYSETAVYNKTLNHWKAHPALDLKAEPAEDVFVMADGVVAEVKEDSMLGYVVSVKSDNYVVSYCGLGKNIAVNKGDTVKSGDLIGVAGTVPSEAMDDPHIHIEIKVNGKAIDPLTVINNNE